MCVTFNISTVWCMLYLTDRRIMFFMRRCIVQLRGEAIRHQKRKHSTNSRSLTAISLLKKTTTESSEKITTILLQYSSIFHNIIAIMTSHVGKVQIVRIKVLVSKAGKLFTQSGKQDSFVPGFSCWEYIDVKGNNKRRLLTSNEFLWIRSQGKTIDHK